MIRPGREPLTGKVEVDETYLGGHEKGGGRRHLGKKSLVMVAAEIRGEGIGRIRLRPIPNTSREHLMGFVQSVVTRGSLVVTDGLPVYMNLTQLGYIHLPRPQNKSEDADKLLPRVHRVSSLLKRWLLGVHQGSFSKRQLAYYLDEFTFRFNRRLSANRGWLFYRLAQQAMLAEPVSLRSIKKDI